ncbi:MAG: hypothetical protein ACI3WQ_12520 [Faecousia sp.]
MSVKTELSERLRREKAKNLRYKKAVSAELNLEQIQQNIWDMQETASNIRWWCAQGDETILDELIGDEEESFELKMAFSTLDYDCQIMLEDMDNEWIPEFFDCFFGAIAGGAVGGMWGYDSYEGDYFGISDRYEEELARKECHKRLKTHTKDEIIEAYAVCFRVAINYIALRTRYDGLKSYIDIINWQNTGYLAIVKRIEELYEKVTCEYPAWKDKQEFESLVENMPDEAWLQ